MTAVCEVCGGLLPADAHFCPHCGAQVAVREMVGERRLVTVLFADLVGSTQLSRLLDPERSRSLLNAYFNAVANEISSARGQLEKFIGDAVMAVFGVPRVHEDDAVRAVRAGLAIVDRVSRLSRSADGEPRLEVRVGLESGVAVTGDGPAGQLLVTGTVVNAAARLQAAARPGEILIGDTTRRLVRDAVRLRRSRAVRARGFADGLVAHPVAALERTSVRRTIPMVGRNTELSLLQQAYERATQSYRPHLVTVIGEAGMGKSRLLDEFLALLPDGVEPLVGRVDAYGGPTVLGPAADILRRLAHISDRDEPQTAVRRLATAVAARADVDDPARMAEDLAVILGVAPARDRDETTLIHDAQHAFQSLIAALSARSPTVLALDDLHLARAPVLDLVERLAAPRRGGPARLLVVATARQDLLDDRPTWGSTAHNHALITLDPLGADDSAELTREAAGQRLGEAASERIAERAGGNPFFIIETTGMLLDAAATDVDAGALPPTVQAVVGARLDRLPTELRDLVQRVSVFLDTFDLQELSLLGEPSLEMLGQLEAAEILTAEDAGRRWRFRHQILHDVAYAGLAKRERMRLHLVIADGLQAAHRYGVADHLERAAQASLDLDPSDRSVPDRAVDSLIEAGDRARRRMESRRAVDRYRRALALAGPERAWGMREARALAGIGEADYWLADFAAAGEALSQAEQLGIRTGDDWTLAVALRFLGEIVLNVDADVDRAEDLLRRSLMSAERLGDPRVISRSLMFAGWVPWTRDDLDEAETIWQRALSLARENRDRWVEARALIAISIAHSEREENAAAARYAEAALAVARDMRDPFNTAVAIVQLSRTAEWRGDPATALAQLDEAAAIFDELGARWELADALFARGQLLEQMGRLDEAERDLRSAVRITDELGARALGSWTAKALRRVLRRREGHPQRALTATLAEPTT